MGDVTARVKVEPDLQSAAQAGAETGETFSKAATKQFRDIYGKLGKTAQEQLRKENPDFFQTPAQAKQNLPFQLNASQLKNLAFAASPLLRPESIWGNIFATRQAFSAMATKSANGKTLAENLGFGGGIKGELLGTGLIIGPLLAIGAAFKVLTGLVHSVIKEFQEMDKQYKKANELYAKVLQSGGLPVKFIAQREAIAKILGVSEADVRFSRALDDLRQKTEMAADSVARTAGSLTAVERSRQITEVNNNAAEAERAKFWSGLNLWLAKTDEWGSKINLITDRWGNDLLHFFHLDGATPVKAPEAFAKQLQTSRYEQMGLVVGGFGIQDYSKQTAHNTRRMVTLLEMIVKPGATTSLPSSHAAI